MDPRNLLTALLVLGPAAGAVLCLVLRSRRVRSTIVLATGGLLALSALLLIPLTPFTLDGGSIVGVELHRLVQAGDVLLLLIILFYGLKYRHRLIIALGLFQLALLGVLEFFMIREVPAFQRITCDQLALMMVLIVSIVGSIICCQAIPYMEAHEHHYRPAHSLQPRFFFVMLIFLGAMNGLVLFNDLTFIYFFFEVTTLCSFLLIGHDRTTVATQNALRALWMNSVGGAAFILGTVAAVHATGSLDLQRVISFPGGTGPGVYLLSLALLSIASFVKSAQFPFQSWLLGAMVAPTPVSALLHSSTMVKVGVYTVLRLAPGFAGTLLSQSIAV
ncbi:MAG: NADH-quinone oxidoreductase subunit L, partial [Desulfobacteraceae bacterium]